MPEKGEAASETSNFCGTSSLALGSGSQEKRKLEIRQWGMVNSEFTSLECKILFEHLQFPNTKSEAQPKQNCFEYYHDIQVDIPPTMGYSQNTGALKIRVPLTSGCMCV